MSKSKKKPASPRSQPADHQDGHELVPGSTAIRGSITHAVVIKHGDLFFLSEPDGSVPLSDGHGFGLYYHDCRFLNGYELRVAGRRPEALVRNAELGYKAVLGLSNPEIHSDGKVLPKHLVEIRWSRVISSERLALFDTFRLQSLAPEPIALPFELRFQSGFEDVFAIRGLFEAKRGKLHPPEWKTGTLHLLYEGADQINREVTIHFSPAPDEKQEGGARFEVALPPRGCQQLSISLLVSESPEKKKKSDGLHRAPPQPRGTISEIDESPWLEGKTHFDTDSLTLDRVMGRSLRDLGVLRSRLRNINYFAAGVPWFVALFGRDSIITALQTLAYDPRIAEQTIRLLADYQGKEIDRWREEEPGKILHELRVGEMAHLNEVPHTPYYGTIDATPLWLLLVGRHAAWTGDLKVFNELRSQIEAALNWIRCYGDRDNDGYIEYECMTEKGLANQGWKDSGDAIVNVDGSLATPPIALVEVQGYVYEAKLEIAVLYRRAGNSERAAELEAEAQKLREQFNRDFWVTDGYYALALQKDNRQAAVLSSNAGQALWSGIVDPDRARETADHLLSPEMFNDWGIRTLSSTASRYNPLGYHLGTVWPHDNSLIAAGFKRYGFDEGVLRVLSGMMEAAVYFEEHRLPELFGGFCKQDYGVPVSYPVACQPQAWSAGAVPYLLTTALGLTPEAFEHRLKITRPVLPANVNHVEIRHLRVGRARVDLVFERKGEQVAARVLDLEGKLEVVME